MIMEWQKQLVLEHRVYCRTTQDAGMALEEMKSKLMGMDFIDSCEEVPEVTVKIRRDQVKDVESKGLLVVLEHTTFDPTLTYRRYRYVMDVASESEAISFLDAIWACAGHVFASIQIVMTVQTDIGPQ